MEIVRVPITTDSAGVATVFSRDKVKGRVARVFVDIGDLASGAVDFTVTGDLSGTAIYSQTNATVDLDAAPTSTTAYCFQERIKVVVAGGGDTKSGALSFAITDGS